MDGGVHIDVVDMSTSLPISPFTSLNRFHCVSHSRWMSLIRFKLYEIWSQVYKRNDTGRKDPSVGPEY